MLLDARPLQGPSARRGIGTYVRGLVGGLVEAGFGPRLALLLDGDLETPELPSGVSTYRVRRRYRGRLAYYEDGYALSADLQVARPALFHATTLGQPSRPPCPVVVTVHDLIPWAYGGRRMLGERFRHWPGRRLLRRADLVLVPSEATAADVRRLARVPERRIRVIPEAAAGSYRPRPGAAQRVAARFGLERPYLLYVGALDARKDPGGLLRAWAAAKAAGADVDLVLAGDPGSQAPARMDGARSLGHVDAEDLADVLGAAACFVFCSRYEGFGLPILEAMACGCPVVAYRNSSLPEVAGEAAVLVADGAAEELGRQAAAVVLDPARRAALSRAGLARARRFSWRRAARDTISAYETLLR